MPETPHGLLRQPNVKGLVTDVLIVGAGPAGALAAALLHRENIPLLVVEKQAFPRFVIGESMLPTSMNLLREAGLLAALEKENFLRKHGAVFLRGSRICNFDFSEQSGEGWEYTYQAPRADFDKVLIDAVAARGVDVLYRHSVTAVDFSLTHARVTVEHDGETLEVKSKFILDCSGYGRVLPRLLQLETPSAMPPRAALFTHVTGDRRPSGREEGKIWVCVHPGGAWIWIIPFRNRRTSVGVVASPEFFDRFPGDTEPQLRAILMSEENASKRLDGVEILFPPRRITGYSCAVKRLYGDRFALAGNASEFLDPVFSSGVALAMSSAQRAAQLLIRQLRGGTVDWQVEYAEPLMHGINTFRAYVNSWYDGSLPAIFFTEHRHNPDIKRQICSALAGYVWDKSNPYVRSPDRALTALAHILGNRRETSAR
jgi:2-polyprenyl-6-methoxyphenol hydroxylase-like FAD-dependent oxidoreductase